MCGLFDLLLPNVFLQRFLCFNCCHIFFASNGKSSMDYYSLVELGHGSKDSGTQLFEKAPDSRPAIVFPPPVTAQWEEQVMHIFSSHVLCTRTGTSVTLVF